MFLFSLNPVYKGKVVAKGNLVTTDSTYVVGGNMLGNEYYGVAVHSVTNIGDERLPRPSENCTTLREAIGFVIPWPRPYVILIISTPIIICHVAFFFCIYLVTNIIS